MVRKISDVSKTHKNTTKKCESSCMPVAMAHAAEKPASAGAVFNFITHPDDWEIEPKIKINSKKELDAFLNSLDAETAQAFEAVFGYLLRNFRKLLEEGYQQN